MLLLLANLIAFAQVDSAQVDPAAAGASPARTVRFASTWPIPPAPSFVDRPIVANLHPVRAQPVRRLMLLLDRNIAGHGASPVFRDVVAAANAYWVPVGVWGLQPLPMTAADQALGRDRMLLALGLAADDWIHETLQRSDFLGALEELGRALTAPTLSIEQDARGTTQVRATAPAESRRHPMARASLYGGSLPPRTPPPRRFRLGSGLRIAGIDDAEGLPLVDGSIFLSGERIAFTRWRLSALLRSQRWILDVRHRVLPQWHVTASTHSNTGELAPAAWTLGTLYDVPRSAFRRAHYWQLRTYLTHVLPSIDVLAGERQLGLELRARWRWRTPWATGRTLGDRGVTTALPVYDANRTRWITR